MKTMYYNFLYAQDVADVLRSAVPDARIYCGVDRYERAYTVNHDGSRSFSDDTYVKYVAGHKAGYVNDEYLIQKLSLEEFTVELPS